MEVHVLEREFLYNGVKLPDTTPTMKVLGDATHKLFVLLLPSKGCRSDLVKKSIDTSLCHRPYSPLCLIKVITNPSPDHPFR
jgi:hypothetical protein